MLNFLVAMVVESYYRVMSQQQIYMFYDIALINLEVQLMSRAMRQLKSLDILLVCSSRRRPSDDNDDPFTRNIVHQIQDSFKK